MIHLLFSSPRLFKTIPLRFFILFILLFAASLFVLPDSLTHSDSSISRLRQQVGKEPSMPTLRGEEAIEHLKQQGSYNSLQEAMAAVKYQAKSQLNPQLAGVGAAQELSNRTNNLLAYVTADGIAVTSLSEEKKSWRLGLQMTGLGYGTNLSAVSSGAVSAKGNRVEIHHNSELRTPNSSNGLSTAIAASNTASPSTANRPRATSHRPPTPCACGWR